MNDNTIGKDELRISIEAGEDYPLTERLKAAVEELGAALEEIDDSDTAGFQFLSHSGFSLNYVSPISSSAISGNKATTQYATYGKWVDVVSWSWGETN